MWPCRFGDASYYYWVLAKQCLENAKDNSHGEHSSHSVVVCCMTARRVSPTERTFGREMVDKFTEYHMKADIYHVYSAIRKYIVR